MALNIFSAMLVLIHLIYDIYLEARRLFDHCRQYFLDIYYGPRSLKSELDFVCNEKSSFGKSLSHLAVILGNESISIKDIVRITLWSQAADITYVSFYDHKGQLKKFKSALDEALVTAGGAKSHSPRTNGYINGFVGKPFPHVTLLDISDGKAGIVRVARQLCEKAHAKEIQPSEVNLESIHEYVMKDAGVPEPDLAMYCGDICSIYGFLPWHSRVTEFLPLRSHHNISVLKFVSLLRRYSKCEQRLGT